MSRPLVATIDIGAMQHNLAVVRSCVPYAKVWTVIKANAYGHGLERAARAFADADGYALTELEAALNLRSKGSTKPILLMEGFFNPYELPIITENKLAVAVHCDEQITMLERAKLDAPLDVHLKMNTGMNRLGFTPDVYKKAWERLKENSLVRSISLMTHFANAEDLTHPHLPSSKQIGNFEAATADIPGMRNLSNSAAILLQKNLKTDMVRPGVMLYGGTPGGKTAHEYGLKPAMTLRSELIHILNVNAGDSIGYGSQFIAPHRMRIGVVACGYADGYPRSAPEGTPVLVDSIKTGIVGRVSMDMLTVDLTAVPAAHFGSSVTLWGEGLPIDEVATAAGTIGYELMCALSIRPRIVEQQPIELHID